MNKKQLQESIMAGVRKAFNANMALNEGFSAWREENEPKFPLQQLNGNTEPLINLFGNYIIQDYIESVQFGITVNETYQKIGILDKKALEEGNVKAFMGTAENILKQKCTKGEDQFNRVMFLTQLKVYISYDSTFGKYVKSTINGGSNRVNEYEDLIIPILADDNIVLVIKIKDLTNVENVNKIIEYFK